MGTKVIAEYENGAAPGSPTREYIYSGRQLLATVAGGTTTYHHADHLSVRLMTDGTVGSPTYGQTLGQRGLYPFGDSLVWYETGTTDKWKFTTYERDVESVNDHTMARSYVNRFGRFSSPDPIAGSVSNPQSLNRYAYVQNDPVDAIDPDGRRMTLTPGDPCGHITPPFGTPSTFPAYDPFWIWNFLPSWFPGNNPDDIWQFINPFFPPGTAYYDPQQQKITDLVNSALKQKNLAKCLKEFFGEGIKLTEANAPYVNASKDLSGADVGKVQHPVPETGRATVLIDRGVFNLPADNPFLVGTYLHEVANALAYQNFTNVRYDLRPYRGPRGSRPTRGQRSHLYDRDIGQQFEECLYRKD